MLSGQIGSVSQTTSSVGFRRLKTVGCESCCRKLKDILPLFILSANDFHVSLLPGV